MMKAVMAPLALFLLLVAELSSAVSSPTTAPAFLWSSHQDGLTKEGDLGSVSYQTLSSKDLAKSVMSKGGWSNLLCSGMESQEPVDLALLFVGEESLEIFGRKNKDLELLDLVKASFTKSNFSLAYPYVAASYENEPLESSLISELADSCGSDGGLSSVVITESCAADGKSYEKLADIHSVHEYLVSNDRKSPKGQATLVVICHKGSDLSKELDQPRSEGQIFSELISSVEQTGAKYSVLYVSDPSRGLQLPSYHHLDRFLAEQTFGNGSGNSTACDGVCQIKSSLLEGILVGLVLLIILISGLCCMMGIDTPTRFEAPQDS